MHHTSNITHRSAFTPFCFNVTRIMLYSLYIYSGLTWNTAGDDVPRAVVARDLGGVIEDESIQTARGDDSARIHPHPVCPIFDCSIHDLGHLTLTWNVKVTGLKLQGQGCETVEHVRP